MYVKLFKGCVWNIHLIFRLGSCWIGCHYSNNQKSYCIALIPCVIIRIAKTQYTHDGDCK